VPTLINIMTSVDDECSLPRSIRLLNLGGEALPPALVNRIWHSGLRIFNTYGPSETTVTATFQEVFPNEPVTIGKPLPMYHALILPILEGIPNSPKPIMIQEGAEGELAIGGKCLGKGYVGRPSLTKEKFIEHPLPSIEGERLYRTGDRVRLDRNLNIVFLGRIDTQVKHRGFRIELGEIENAIAAHPRVQTAAVILSTTTDCLEAYIVVSGGDVIDIKELRGKLESLPVYMQPEGFYFIAAKEMPRLPSGKINAKALQDVSAQFALQKKEHRVKGQQDDEVNVIPEDDSELSILLRGMVAIFPQAADITPKCDFFDDLGGHSLAAAMLVSKLRKESPEGSPLRRLGLKDIYIFRTAEQIAGSLVYDSCDEDTLHEKGKGLHADNGKAQAAQVGEHWPVSQRNYVMCGLAQVPALLFFFFMQSINLLAPYLVFHFVLQVSDLGVAILATYLAFVVIPLFMAVVGIAGKWIALGKAKAGEYPLYGVYYYRWWLAQHFVALVDMVTIADTPILPALMRLMGANVGAHCHIGAMDIGAAFDLVSIGDDVVVGKDTVLATSWIEPGRLILAPVRIESQTHIGSNSVLEGDSIVEEGGELGPMTMLPSGAHVPAGEKWHGSPAQFQAHSLDVGNMRASRPSEMRVAAMLLATSFSTIFVLPILSFLPQIPSILLLEYATIPGVSTWIQTAIVAVPAALVYIFLVFFTLFVLRWLVLGVVRERSFRTTSFYYFRKWFVDRLMDMSLVILHPVYATLYVVPFLNSLGVKIGQRAEVSTARGVNFELTEIGDESFIADGVLLGDGEIRSSTVTIKRTKLHARAFAGNASLVPQGTELASNTLVGVLSVAPQVPLKEGQSCFGSPPVLMPSRQRASTEHADHLLYAPHWTQVTQRLFIEGVRIVLPRFLIILGLGYGVGIFEIAYPEIDVVSTIVLMPFFYFFRKCPI
jgi:non-ribosomal peptide synthetase-like protein